MKRIYEAAAYQDNSGRFWAETAPADNWPRLSRDLDTEFAIVGGGFTGLNAALAIADSGASVAVLDAQSPGWGASGRNGGFCCIGGSKLSNTTIRKRYGDTAAEDWFSAQKHSVAHVQSLLAEHEIDADTHSSGETQLAHTQAAWRDLQSEARQIQTDYGVAPRLIGKSDLKAEGLNGPWHGAMTTPLGMALNPQKYHSGLAGLAGHRGVQLYEQSPVTSMTPDTTGWCLQAGDYTVRARKVILATNGYSSEDLPDWLRSRYLPVQSSIILTRPLTADEQHQAGWWSSQMAYDTRKLLHYFRLLPDGRFLFGMRGGLKATSLHEARLSRKIRADFARLFPAWQNVEITHSWSGLICLMPGLVPFTGPVDGHPGLYAAMGFHGNGVAMGSYCGHLLGQHLTKGDPLPAVMTGQPRRFPLGRYRRSLLAPAYWAAETLDL